MLARAVSEQMPSTVKETHRPHAQIQVPERLVVCTPLNPRALRSGQVVYATLAGPPQLAARQVF